MTKPILWISCLCLLSSVSLLEVPAVAGVIKGRICDDGEDPPADGLSGVSVVVITASGQEIDGGTTAADGSFQVDNVPTGKATVKLTKLGYSDDPTEIPVEVTPGENNVKHTWMWVTDPADQGYFLVVARHILRRVGDSDNKELGYLSEWVLLTTANLSPAFKRKLSVEIDKLDDSAKKAVPIIGEYLKTEPASIDRLQLMCSAVATGEGEFPNKNKLQTLEVPSSILAEIILWKAYDPSVASDKRVAFVRSFKTAWTLESGPAATLRAWHMTHRNHATIPEDVAGDSYKNLLELYQYGATVDQGNRDRFR